MDILHTLESKITNLLETIKNLRTENEILKGDVTNLQGKLEALESSLLKETKSLEELSQERALTKMVVDDLIKNIDQFVGIETTVQENQQ